MGFSEPLKLFYDRPLVARIAAALHAAWPAFPSARFTHEAAAGLDRLELLARARQIAAALARALPAAFPEASAIVVRSLGPALERTEGFGMDGFFYLPHVLWVAERGLDDLEPALEAQHALTQRFTAEFSIRPYLTRYPAETLARLARWSADPSPHVRRLVSEGTRPRLPWAPRLPQFQRDPGPVLALLERLKDDAVLYVRRSVANNLNDVGKDHPDLLLDTCARWIAGAGPARLALVRHALRYLDRRGDRRARELRVAAGSRRRVGTS
jgi:3-methyladenine DNA glycosylase AlkC